MTSYSWLFICKKNAWGQLAVDRCAQGRSIQSPSLVPSALCHQEPLWHNALKNTLMRGLKVKLTGADRQAVLTDECYITANNNTETNIVHPAPCVYWEAVVHFVTTLQLAVKETFKFQLCRGISMRLSSQSPRHYWTKSDAGIIFFLLG